MSAGTDTRPRGYLQALFENSPEAVGLIDGDLRVVVWNRAATAMTGYKPGDVVGRACRVNGTRLVLAAEARHPEAASATLPPAAGPSLYVLDIDDGPGETSPVSVFAGLTPLLHEDVAYLLHLIPPARLALAAQGDGWMPGVIGEPGRSREGALAPRTMRSALTRREQQILTLLAAGKTAKPIARELSLSLTTVRTHIQHILSKLGVHSCLEAVVCWLRVTAERGTG